MNHQKFEKEISLDVISISLKVNKETNRKLLNRIRSSVLIWERQKKSVAMVSFDVVFQQ